MIRIVSRDSTLPVSVERARAFLRLETDIEDGLLKNLIEAAIQEIELYTGVLLSKCVYEWNCEWTQHLSKGLVSQPQKEVSLTIPHAPFVRMISIQIGEQQITKYRVKLLPQGVAVCDIVLPEKKIITLTYEAGFKEAPEALKLAILECVAFRYQNRGEGALKVPGLQAFLNPYRLIHL